MNRKFRYISFFIIIFFVLIIELSLKTLKPSIYESDPELGWKTKENFNYTFNYQDFYNQSYKSKYYTNNQGLRFYGNNNFNDYKILVLGDSFTMDSYVGNDEMWFSFLSKKLVDLIGRDITVFAGGAGAYGTLQELIVLKKVKDTIQPDLFILQFCENDFFNNSKNLEKQNYLISQYMRRPYYNLDKKEIFYDESIYSKLFRISFINESRIVNKLIFYFEKFLRNNFSKNEYKDKEKLIYESKVTTAYLLSEINLLFKNIPTFIFNCSNNSSAHNNNWAEIAYDSGFKVLKESSKFISKSKKENKKIFYKDGGHLNILGNELWAGSIFNEIKNNLD